MFFRNFKIKKSIFFCADVAHLCDNLYVGLGGLDHGLVFGIPFGPNLN